MPRPSALTPDVHLAIVRAAEKGVTRKAAAYIGGVSDRTLRSWIERGEDGEEPYATFARDMAEAESKVEQLMTASILHCAVKKKDWRAAQAWLEKRVPEWRPNAKLELSGSLETKKASPEAAAAAVREQFGGHAAKDDTEPEGDEGSASLSDLAPPE